MKEKLLHISEICMSVTLNAYYESSSGQKHRVPSKYDDVNKLKFFYKMPKHLEKQFFSFPEQTR